MNKARGFEEVPDQLAAVVAIGVFDGVHSGHREIIRVARERAQALGVASLVLTFEPHPVEFFSGDRSGRLTDPRLKEGLLAELDPDWLLVVPFDRDFSLIGHEQFIDLLITRLSLQGVVVGANFHYGHKAEGTPQSLVVAGEKRGFAVDLVPLVSVSGRAVSSTAIRELIKAGSVGLAAKLLGRPPRVIAKVVAGHGRGADLGIHTANLETPYAGSIPGPGVYAGTAHLEDGSRSPAAISVGHQPTFDSGEEVCEVHVIGFEGDLYGQEIELEFAHRLREQRKYDTPEELVVAIREDIEETLRLAQES